MRIKQNVIVVQQDFILKKVHGNVKNALLELIHLMVHHHVVNVQQENIHI
jgi:hypothetical protein